MSTCVPTWQFLFACPSALLIIAITLQQLLIFFFAYSPLCVIWIVVFRISFSQSSFPLSVCVACNCQFSKNITDRILSFWMRNTFFFGKRLSATNVQGINELSSTLKWPVDKISNQSGSEIKYISCIHTLQSGLCKVKNLTCARLALSSWAGLPLELFITNIDVSTIVGEISRSFQQL